MGLFDMTIPGAGGWDTQVNPGNGSFLDKLRFQLTGSADKNPDLAKTLQAGTATFAQAPGMGGGAQPKLPGAPPAPPPMGGGAQGFQTAMANMTKPVTGSPFIGVGSGGSLQAGGPEAAAMPGGKKKPPPIFAPFTAG